MSSLADIARALLTQNGAKAITLVPKTRPLLVARAIGEGESLELFDGAYSMSAQVTPNALAVLALDALPLHGRRVRILRGRPFRSKMRGMPPVMLRIDSLKVLPGGRAFRLPDHELVDIFHHPSIRHLLIPASNRDGPLEAPSDKTTVTEESVTTESVDDSEMVRLLPAITFAALTDTSTSFPLTPLKRHLTQLHRSRRKSRRTRVVSLLDNTAVGTAPTTLETGEITTEPAHAAARAKRTATIATYSEDLDYDPDKDIDAQRKGNRRKSIPKEAIDNRDNTTDRQATDTTKQKTQNRTTPRLKRTRKKPDRLMAGTADNSTQNDEISTEEREEGTSLPTPNVSQKRTNLKQCHKTQTEIPQTQGTGKGRENSECRVAPLTETPDDSLKVKHRQEANINLKENGNKMETQKERKMGLRKENNMSDFPVTATIDGHRIEVNFQRMKKGLNLSGKVDDSQRTASESVENKGPHIPEVVTLPKQKDLQRPETINTEANSIMPLTKTDSKPTTLEGKQDINTKNAKLPSSHKEEILSQGNENGVQLSDSNTPLAEYVERRRAWKTSINAHATSNIRTPPLVLTTNNSIREKTDTNVVRAAEGRIEKKRSPGKSGRPKTEREKPARKEKLLQNVDETSKGAGNSDKIVAVQTKNGSSEKGKIQARRRRRASTRKTVRKHLETTVTDPPTSPVQEGNFGNESEQDNVVDNRPPQSKQGFEKIKGKHPLAPKIPHIAKEKQDDNDDSKGSNVSTSTAFAKVSKSRVQSEMNKTYGKTPISDVHIAKESTADNQRKDLTTRKDGGVLKVKVKMSQSKQRNSKNIELKKKSVSEKQDGTKDKNHIFAKHQNIEKLPEVLKRREMLESDNRVAMDMRKEMESTIRKSRGQFIQDLTNSDEKASGAIIQTGAKWNGSETDTKIQRKERRLRREAQRNRTDDVKIESAITNDAKGVAGAKEMNIEDDLGKEGTEKDGVKQSNEDSLKLIRFQNANFDSVSTTPKGTSINQQNPLPAAVNWLRESQTILPSLVSSRNAFVELPQGGSGSKKKVSKRISVKPKSAKSVMSAEEGDSQFVDR